MRIPHPRPGPRGWLRLPRRSARLRLTVLYAVAFLACGAAVLALTYLLAGPTPPPVSSSGRPESSRWPRNSRTRVPAAYVRRAAATT